MFKITILRIHSGRLPAPDGTGERVAKLTGIKIDRVKIGMFARQTGKTFTTTLELVDDCFEAWARGQRRRWVILSRGERQAKEAMDEGVKLHAKAYGTYIDEDEFTWLGDRKENGEREEYKALEVVLRGGSRITALPASPDTARGYSANVFLDEFAIHPSSREIWKALFPVISAGHKIRVTSTPKGKGNKFYDLMTAQDSTWSRHTVDIYQAVAEGLPRNIEELRAGLAAGGLAAIFYAAYCTDDSPLFVATWYSLAVLMLTVLGAVVGRMVLRW